jgi:hypothetical protein
MKQNKGFARMGLRHWLALLTIAVECLVPANGLTLPNPVLFVTQVPIGDDFTTIGSVFGNHKAGTDYAGRGGDLYIRYTDGTLKNLTAAAGFGKGDGFQGAGSIAVRDPAVHWNGTKAIFSMVIGAPAKLYVGDTNVWQLYEVTHFGATETPVITKVPNQPARFNNISACYGTDGRIIFTSDRPRNGQQHLYPQLDEYELAPTVTGLWSLDPLSGDLFQLDHAPSGSFTPIVDSFGRVIFTRWDHLQRDQEADADAEALAQGESLPYATFNFGNESANAKIFPNDRSEVFPEARSVTGNVNHHTFNQFFPWMINEDGTEEETLNHIGRHELASYMEGSFLDDPDLETFYNVEARFNTNFANNILQMKEDPRNPGVYFGTDSPEFFTHASGQILTLTGPPGLDADKMQVNYITHPETKSFSDNATTNHSGHYREPVPMSDGTIIAVHTPNTDLEKHPDGKADYTFRLKTLKKAGSYWVADQMLTAGVSKTVSYYENDSLVNYSGLLWELNPVEVRARTVPQGTKTPLGTPEQQIFNEETVNVAELRDYLRTNDLALIVSRNLTTRDHADRQQPYNLRVAGTATQTVGSTGKIYDIASLQLFQADQIRGYGLYRVTDTPRNGRRVLAQPLHDPASVSNNIFFGSAAGSVKLANDGSMAAIVPARRAMTWQLNDLNGSAVVRERFWLTFQPGEIRTCTSCHGLNTRDQANNPVPVNKPEALRALLQAWKTKIGSAGIPRFTGINRSANGHVHLSFQGSSARTSFLQSSTDLGQWTTIQTNAMGADTGFEFEDAAASNPGSHFYRIIAP